MSPVAVWVAATLCVVIMKSSDATTSWREPVFAVNSSVRGVVYGYGTYDCKSNTDPASCQTNHTVLPHSAGVHRGILTLDLFQPISTPTGPTVPDVKPAMVLMHGGSYVNGESYSDNMPHSAAWFAARGWVALSINYRPSFFSSFLLPYSLTPIQIGRVRGQAGLIPAGFPPGMGYTPQFRSHVVNGTVLKYGWLPSFAMMYPAIRDAKAAVRWVRANAKLLGIDPEMIVAYGSSAGGCSAVSLGANIEKDFKSDLHVGQVDPTLESTHLEESSSVAAVVSHWGAMHGIEAIEQHTNTSRVTSRFAPTIAFHGSSDYAVSPNEERALCARLDKDLEHSPLTQTDFNSAVGWCAM